MSSYIVVFKKSATAEEINKYVEQVTQGGGDVKHKYDSVLKGFSATIPDSVLQTFNSNLQDGPIDYIEPDQVVTTQ